MSISGSVFVTMIAVGVQPAPNLNLDATHTIGFSAASLPVVNIGLVYVGHVAFSSFIYVMVAIVIYRYTEQDVTSPALGNASNVVMKVAFGIALPTVSSLLYLSYTNGTLNELEPAGGRHVWRRSGQVSYMYASFVARSI